ncbi:MAG: hypothetical protein N2423_08705, partial [Novosphingobium sp.]|nr:hypothetical protein [Novosphingobium sp.]
MTLTANHAVGKIASLSTLAFAMAVGMAAGSIALPEPALAAKSKQEQGPKLKLSPAFQAAIAKSIAAFNKKDIATAQAELAASEAAISSNDDRFQYFSMMLNIGLTTKDEAMQIKGLRGMLDTGLVPADRVGQY